MKKNGLLLLAGLAMLLTGCGGKRYTSESSQAENGESVSIKYVLTLRDDTFTLKSDMEIETTELNIKTKGSESGTYEAVANLENVYKLVTTEIVYSGFSCEGTKATEYSSLYKIELRALGLTEEQAADVVAGKKVKVELAENKYVSSYVKLDEENMKFTAYTYTLF